MTSNSKSSFSMLVGAIAIVFGTLSGTAAAQTEELEEIVVTAQRRAENSSDVGISLNAFDADTIKNLGIDDANSLAAYTPGLRMVNSQGYGGKVNFTLRGVGINTYFESQEPAVAIYQDEVYLAPIIGAIVGAYDLERIEVLRGPQGTLFGRSTSGGLVHYITKKPTRELDGYLGLKYGSFNERRAEMALGGPLTDTVRARVSSYWSEYDGWLENTIGSDRYPEQRHAFRGQVLFQPRDNVELLLSAERAAQRNENGLVFLQVNTFRDASDNNKIKDLPANVDPTPFGLPVGPGNDFSGFRDTDGDFFTGTWGPSAIGDLKNDIDRTLLTGILTWDFGAATLTGVTGYLNADKDHLECNDATPSCFVGVGQTTTTDEFVQELRLSGDMDKRRWTAGIFYFNWDIENNQFYRFPSGLFPPYVAFGGIFGPFNLDYLSKQSKDAIAGYGQVEYDFADRFTAIFGLRYEHEEGEFSLDQMFNPLAEVTALFGGVPPLTFNEAANGDFARIDNDYYSGTVGLNWRANEDTLVYGSFRRGIKPATFNNPFSFLEAERFKVNEEQLHAYELGTKIGIPGRRMQVNASAFYYDYRDMQVQFIQDLSTLLTNADAEIYGIDLEVLANPVAGLNLGLGLSVLEGEVKDIGFLAPGNVTVIRNREVPNMPKYSAVAKARYEWPAFGGTMALQGDVQLQDQVFFEIQNDPAISADAYVVGDVRAAWNNASYEIAAFVKNISNEEYVYYVANNNDFGGYKNVTPGKPRWWGVEFRYSWGGK